MTKESEEEIKIRPTSISFPLTFESGTDKFEVNFIVSLKIKIKISFVL